MSRFVTFAATIALASGCESTVARPMKAPRSDEVVVTKELPPPGSRDLGPVEGTNGTGCSFPIDRGSLESAMIVLRNSAAARGANFVTLLSTTSPSAGNQCSYTVSGLAYEVTTTGPQAVSSGSGGCDPICSPGYRCEQRTCVAVCNPLCAPDQVCRPDRTCGPRP